MFCFRPYDYRCDDIIDRGIKHSCLRIWGMTRDNKIVCCKLNDFYPVLRIEMPSQHDDGKRVKWTPDMVQSIFAEFCDLSKNQAPIKYEFNKLKRIYSRIEVPVITLFFASDQDKYSFRKKIREDQDFKVWEDKITTIHRFITYKKMSYTQWLSIKDPIFHNNITIADCEFECSKKELFPISDEDTSEWRINPMTCSLDIEVYSHKHNQFPSAINYADCTTMISLIFRRMFPEEDGTDDVHKILLTIYKTSNVRADIEVDTFNQQKDLQDNELDMIHGLNKYFKKYRPTVILGFNTLKFDFPYLNDRIKQIWNDEWPNLSMMVDGIYGEDKPITDIISMDWESSAQRQVIIRKLNAEGMINADVFRIMRAERPTLDRHSLDFLCKEFLNKGKDDVSPQEMFRIHLEYKNNLSQEIIDEVSKVVVYCIKDSELTYELVNKLNLFTSIMELSSILQVTPEDVYTRGQQLRVINQLFFLAFWEGYILNDEVDKIGRFGGAYVVPPIPGLHKSVICLDFASLYPSIVICYNICYTTFVSDDMEVPDEDCHIIEWEELDPDLLADSKSSKRRAAEIGEIPKIKYRYRFLKASVYEGIIPRMCSKLISERKKVRSRMTGDISSFMKRLLDTRQNGLKTCANSIYGFFGAQTLPLKEASACVTAKGREMNHQCQKYVRDTYNGEVIYGDTDSIMITIPNVFGGETEMWGKRLSQEISDLFQKPLKLEFEKAFFRVIFVTKKRYAGCLLSYFDKSQIKYIELHKSKYGDVHQFIFKGKEHFLLSDVDSDNLGGLLVMNKYGDIDPKSISKRGLANVRRNFTQWTKTKFNEILIPCVLHEPLPVILSLINKQIMDLLQWNITSDPEISMKNFLTLSTEVGDYKETSTHPMKLFTEQQMIKGKPLQRGERILTIFVKNGNASKVGEKMCLLSDYNHDTNPLDLLFYIEKQYLKPITQLISLIYKSDFDKIMTFIRDKHYATTYNKEVQRLYFVNKQMFSIQSISENLYYNTQYMESFNEYESSQFSKYMNNRKIKTFISEKYIIVWLKLLRQKSEIMNEIKNRTILLE